MMQMITPGTRGQLVHTAHVVQPTVTWRGSHVVIFNFFRS